MKYHPATLVNVALDFGDGPHNVGRLAVANRRIYFEYDPAFLGSGLEISPFKLPLRHGAVPCGEMVFDGLFGVFNDSLPDGWGRLLLDRRMRQLGIAPSLLTPLDRLSHVGASGMGALVYEPDASVHSSRSDVISLHLLKLAEKFGI